MKIEGIFQKKLRQLKAEFRKPIFWYKTLMPLCDEARNDFESAKTKKDLHDAMRNYFGFVEAEQDDLP